MFPLEPLKTIVRWWPEGFQRSPTTLISRSSTRRFAVFCQPDRSGWNCHCPSPPSLHIVIRRPLKCASFSIYELLSNIRAYKFRDRKRHLISVCWRRQLINLEKDFNLFVDVNNKLCDEIFLIIWFSLYTSIAHWSLSKQYEKQGRFVYTWNIFTNPKILFINILK